MTKLGEMLFDDGVKAGEKKGEEKMSKLTIRLLDEKRYGDLERAVKDRNTEKNYTRPLESDRSLCINCWYIPILFATIGEKICQTFSNI